MIAPKERKETDEADRIMGRLVRMPPKPHKDEQKRAREKEKDRQTN
jgi:hypothetical protein